LDGIGVDGRRLRQFAHRRQFVMRLPNAAQHPFPQVVLDLLKQGLITAGVNKEHILTACMFVLAHLVYTGQAALSREI
jgi:hypothetical protein